MQTSSIHQVSTAQQQRPSRMRIGTLCDDPVRVEGLADILRDQADLMPVTATDAVRDLDLDMVLLDVTNELFALMAAYRRARPALRLLVFGQDSDPRHITRIVAAGAKGYLTYAATADEIRMAAFVIADGSIWAPRKVLAGLIDTYSPASDVALRAHVVSFTPRERGVLDLLVRGHSDREIADQLGLSSRTVQGVVSTLLRKTNVANRVALTVRALERHLLA